MNFRQQRERQKKIQAVRDEFYEGFKNDEVLLALLQEWQERFAVLLTSRGYQPVAAPWYQAGNHPDGSRASRQRVTAFVDPSTGTTLYAVTDQTVVCMNSLGPTSAIAAMTWLMYAQAPQLFQDTYAVGFLSLTQVDGKFDQGLTVPVLAEMVRERLALTLTMDSSNIGSAEFMNQWFCDRIEANTTP